MTTGQLIKAARIKAGLTQAALAEKLGISYVGVSQWENGIRNPKPETLQKIADALDTSVSSLVGRGDDILSPSLQRAFREAFLKRVEGELMQADSVDILEEYFGTANPYEDIFEGRETLTLKMAEDMADELGVPLEYLIAGENSPADDLVEAPATETSGASSALGHRQVEISSANHLLKDLVYQYGGSQKPGELVKIIRNMSKEEQDALFNASITILNALQEGRATIGNLTPPHTDGTQAAPAP